MGQGLVEIFRFRQKGVVYVLCIFHPPTYRNERSYIYDTLLRDFLGVDYQSQVQDRCDICITFRGDPAEKKLILPDILFQTPWQDWLKPASLPKQPINYWDISGVPVETKLVKPEIPVIYGKKLSNDSYCSISCSQVELGVDIFGSAFFLLTRYEEIVKPGRDAHERFTAYASLAFEEGFLTRPVVNEYLELLWWALKYLWPGLKRKARKFRVNLTHDVDQPLCTAGKSFFQMLKSTVGDLLKRNDCSLALERWRSFARVKQGDLESDIGNTFDFIMDLSEAYELKSSFYFITDCSEREKDCTYSIDDPWIRKLLRRIHTRGHEVGLHPSYHTFRDPVQLKNEFENLLRVCSEEGIHQSSWGGRQHYLRWENPTTWQLWDDAGLSYDSTLSFADCVGFRCGVCYEYPVFNLKTRRPLRLRERPLIVMDVTPLQYMGLSHDAAVEKITELKDICKLFQGEFTLLWHNSTLLTVNEKKLYCKVVKESVGI